MIRVLIADGQAEVRRGLQMRLAIEPDLGVIGETGSGAEALALAQALQPDVVVVDIEMRGAQGVHIVERLRAAAPAAAVVVLTLHGDEHTRVQAQAAGAVAFLEKDAGAADLIQVLRQLARGKLAEDGCAPTSALAGRRPSVG